MVSKIRLRFGSLKKRINYFKLGKGLSFKNRDSDGDGVPNWKDCRPFDPTKQDSLQHVQISNLVALFGYNYDWQRDWHIDYIVAWIKSEENYIAINYDLVYNVLSNPQIKHTLEEAKTYDRNDYYKFLKTFVNRYVKSNLYSGGNLR